jgi:vitamin B12 transporter
MRLIILFLIVLVLLAKKPSYAEIPVIVISPSKTSQSLSRVGSDITVIDESVITNSNSQFLGDILDAEITGSNYSKQGGHGTNSLIQIRGLPKRYTNVYIDGVKQSDPSSPDNAFYLNNLTSSSINSIELMKGNQSSIYGSSAIGGVLNIYSRTGNEKKNKIFNINTGSNNQKNAAIIYGNNYENYNYSFTYEKFITDGISAMKDNDENDSYKNDNLSLALGVDLNKSIRIENNFKYSNTFLNYDEVTAGRSDENNTDDQDYSTNIKIINDHSKGSNKFALNHYYIKRKVANYDNSSSNYYYGERKNLNYLGEYNFNLDNKIIFGLDNEFNRANFTTWAVTGNKITDETVNSQYLDYQNRLNKKVFTTLGLRNDMHSEAGSFQTGRVTLAVNKNSLTKYRGSFGTGIRFGSLNDYYYDTNVLNKESLKPEKSYSFDFGLDKKFLNQEATINLTFFYTEYDDNISNWRSNTDSGRSSFIINNSEGKIKSKGFDFKLKKNIYKNISTSIKYTFTDAYDGEDCDDPDKSSRSCTESKYPVRVPKHFLSTSVENKFNDFLSSKLSLKYVSSRRDYGNANNSFGDVMLDDFIVVNLRNNFEIFNHKFFFNINNILNEKYEEAYQYSSMGRSFNLGLKKLF